MKRLRRFACSAPSSSCRPFAFRRLASIAGVGVRDGSRGVFTHDKEDGSLSVWVAVRYSTVSHEVDVSKCSREMAVALF